MITQLAELFHIAPSALRYWDKEGLIRFQRSPENNYRQLTAQTIIDISEVLLHRSLSLPLGDIRAIPTMNDRELSAMLLRNEETLAEEIREAKRTIQRIHAKQETLSRYRLLRDRGFTVQRQAFPAVKDFSFHSESDMQRYVWNPQEAPLLLLPNGELLYGLFTHAPEAPLLRKADPEAKDYLNGLYRMPSQGGSTGNQQEFWEGVRRRGAAPGPILGIYLLSACDGIRYDYYEGWAELKNL